MQPGTSLTDLSTYNPGHALANSSPARRNRGGRAGREGDARGNRPPPRVTQLLALPLLPGTSQH